MCFLHPRTLAEYASDIVHLGVGDMQVHLPHDEVIPKVRCSRHGLFAATTVKWPRGAKIHTLRLRMGDRWCDIGIAE
jgi:hypothetical protein